jgi:hypothetical protein
VLFCALLAVYLLGRRHRGKSPAGVARQPSSRRPGEKPELDPSAELPRTHGRAELESNDLQLELTQPSQPRAELDDTSLSDKTPLPELKA